MTQSSQKASVLELLASRICHDLISPVGAINNGVEFMQDMGPESSDDALELIAYSAEQAAAKLQAFRIAYGAGGKDPNIKPEDIQKAFSKLIAGDGKISQIWDPYGPLGPKPIPLGFCKMLMCSLMLAAETLPKGGSIYVKPGDGRQTLIVAEGEGAMIRDKVDEALKADIAVDDLDPRLVHPYAIGVIAGHYGFSIQLLQKEDGKITFALNSPAEAVEEPPMEEQAQPAA